MTSTRFGRNKVDLKSKVERTRCHYTTEAQKAELLDLANSVRVRRFSFNIDLTGKDSSADEPVKRSSQRTPPPVADGFEFSGDLSKERQFLEHWPGFQRDLMSLPELTGTTDDWKDVNLAAEYIRVYGVSKAKIIDAEPGFQQAGKTETHCFFTPDGSKLLVSRLLDCPHQRINEIRLTPQGQLIRLYYEKTDGREQNLDQLFETGLLDLDQDLNRFSSYPNYALRFFLLRPEGHLLEATFRGVTYFNSDEGRIVTEEAAQL